MQFRAKFPNLIWFDSLITNRDLFLNHVSGNRRKILDYTWMTYLNLQFPINNKPGSVCAKSQSQSFLHILLLFLVFMGGGGEDSKGGGSILLISYTFLTI